jgi:hypothetical protein
MPNTPLTDVRNAVEHSLQPTPDDLWMVDYVLAVAATNYMDGDPLWGWLIGPPGSMKTEFLRGLDDHTDTFFLSSLTPQALVSGYETKDGEDPSLLPQFDGKLVVIKEFTSIIQLPEPQVRQIFGDLRSMYDGVHGKGFGTVGVRRYKSRFSMLAAVTPAIDKYTMVHTDLGERYIAFRLSRLGGNNFDERRRVATHVWEAADTKKQWRQELQQAMTTALDYFRTIQGQPLPSFSTEDRDMLIGLADLLSILRTVPEDPLTPVDPEIASRTTQQVKLLAAGRAVADGRTSINAEDIDLVRRVVFDTLPAAISRSVLYFITEQERHGADHYLSLKAAAKQLQIPLQWLIYVARQYGYCGLLDCHGDMIRCTNDFTQKIAETKLLEAQPTL